MKKSTNTTQAIARGIALGSQLAARASSALLEEFCQRDIDPKNHQTFSNQFKVLRGLIGDIDDIVLDDPAGPGSSIEIQKALAALENAHGLEIAAAEDLAWHAAWTAATRLGGAR